MAHAACGGHVHAHVARKGSLRLEYMPWTNLLLSRSNILLDAGVPPQRSLRAIGFLPGQGE
eukprot:2190645-Pleurochrysis_carterae.AAC.4